MKDTFVIDTNGVLRYLLADHPEQFARARELLERVKSGEARAYLSEGMIIECVYVLLKVYRVPRAEVASSLSDLLRYKGLVNDNIELLLKALELFRDRNVDIVDALVHSLAESRGWTVFGFDADLDRLGR